MSEIDHWMTDNAVCPHCGFEDYDTWEFFSDTSSSTVIATCGECENEFEIYQSVFVRYSTSIIKKIKD